ncbi:MAG: peptidoglycan DD-metalloendopeptidase family protein [Halanaerobiaceae bacterium]
MKKFMAIFVLFVLVALYGFSGTFLAKNNANEGAPSLNNDLSSNYNITNNKVKEEVPVMELADKNGENRRQENGENRRQENEDIENTNDNTDENSDEKDSKSVQEEDLNFVEEIKTELNKLNSINTEEKSLLIANDILNTDNENKNKNEFSLESDAVMEIKILSAELSSRENIGPFSEKNEETTMISRNSIEVDTRIEEPSRKKSLLDQVRVHKVENGDNLWDIAGEYDIDIDTLIGANDITNMNTIGIGDELKILPVKGILYTVNPGESLWTVSRKFNVSSAKIVEANGLDDPDLVQPGVSLILPGVKPEFGYQDRLAESFMRPLSGGRVSSPFGPRWGRMHTGIDYAVSTGTEIRAARAGKIVYSGWSTGYGETVIIEHQKGVRSLYAHNSRLLVRGGQHVERGQVIALSGNTGNSTGPHLHFEIQINGKPVNPANYLPD